MDIKQDEENLCGQIGFAAERAKETVRALLAKYLGEMPLPYPGKDVVERGAALIGGILDRRGDNVAMLEAFTRAEDDLLDWKEDIAEVEFFFKNQADVFRDAYRLSEQAERDIPLFCGRTAGGGGGKGYPRHRPNEAPLSRDQTPARAESSR